MKCSYIFTTWLMAETRLELGMAIELAIVVGTPPARVSSSGGRKASPPTYMYM